MAASVKNRVIRHRDSLRTPYPGGAALSTLFSLLDSLLSGASASEAMLIENSADSANKNVVPCPPLLLFDHNRQYL